MRSHSKKILYGVIPAAALTICASLAVPAAFAPAAQQRTGGVQVLVGGDEETETPPVVTAPPVTVTPEQVLPATGGSGRSQDETDNGAWEEEDNGEEDAPDGSDDAQDAPGGEDTQDTPDAYDAQDTSGGGQDGQDTSGDSGQDGRDTSGDSGQDGRDASGDSGQDAGDGSAHGQDSQTSGLPGSGQPGTVSSAAEAPEEDPLPADRMPSLLTGEAVPIAIGQRRPAAFLYDNDRDAQPQYGLSGADIYMECGTEGGSSAICAVTEHFDSLPKIGPLRSCRDYFLSLCASFDAVFCHNGQSAYSLSFLESDNIDNLSAVMGYAGEAFFKDGPHAAPHNVYMDGRKLAELAAGQGYRAEYGQEGTVEPALSFRTAAEAGGTAGGKDAAYVSLGYPGIEPYFVYNEEDGLYYRWQDGAEHVDAATGEQLSVKNLLLEFQDCTTYGDTEYLHFNTWGSGSGLYIADGKAVEINWRRKSFFAPAEYTAADGTPLGLSPGKTWISVISRDRLADCLAGSSEETAACAVDPAFAASEKEETQKWASWYRSIEDTYLKTLAQKRNDYLAAHGNLSKAEP